MRNLFLPIALGIGIMADAQTISNENRQYDSKFLRYENIYTDIQFDYDFLQNIEINNELFEVTDTTLSNIRTLQKVDSNLIETLIKFHPINKWDSVVDYALSVSYEEALQFARECDYYFIGQTIISSDFKSLLFLQMPKEQDYYFVLKEIYLVNIKNGLVKSIVRVFDYSCFDGSSDFSHTYFDEEHFVYKQMELSTDVIEPCPTGPEIHYAKFSFDQQGYVVIK